MALIDLDTLQRIPNLKNMPTDFLNELVVFTDGVVKAYTKQWLEQQTVTNEYHNGDNSQFIRLRELPVQSISDLRYDPTGFYGQSSGGFASTTALTAGTHYVLVIDDARLGYSKSGLVQRIGGSGAGFPFFYPDTLYAGKLSARREPVWPHGVGNLRVTYVSGYPAASIPDDLRTACVELAAWLAMNLPSGGPLSSESLGGYSYSRGQELIGEMPALGTVKQILGRYRDPSF